MTYGLPFVKGDKQPCEACKLGKHHREKFPKGKSWRAFKLLMLLHANVCGPMQTLSLSESKYFFIFVDEF